MKKVLVFSSLFALAASAAFGTPAPPPACSTVSANALAGYTCEIGDKIFSNISLTGAPTTGTVSFAGGGTTYTLDFANYSSPLTTSFTFAFTVAVDLVSQPQNYISQIQDTMLTSNTSGNSIPNNTTAVVTHTPGGVVNLAGSPNSQAQNGSILLNTTSDTVSFAFTPGANGVFNDASFVISQSSVPEPVTFSLMGIGLLGIGLLRKRLS
jgi:hypothetical protein